MRRNRHDRINFLISIYPLPTQKVGGILISCENVGGVADDPQCQNNAVWGDSVKPGDDLYLNFDVWAEGDGGANGNASQTMYLRNEISAMANKIQPHGNPGGQWFNTDTSRVTPGTVITTNGILYRIGNVRFGFDNDGDYLPDYNFWMQPIGDAGQFDTGCFRLIRTSGIITITGGSNTSFTFDNQLYFTYPQVPTDNTNVIGEVFYTFQSPPEQNMWPVRPAPPLATPR